MNLFTSIDKVCFSESSGRTLSRPEIRQQQQQQQRKRQT